MSKIIVFQNLNCSSVHLLTINIRTSSPWKKRRGNLKLLVIIEIRKMKEARKFLLPKRRSTRVCEGEVVITQ
jgi:hypothetical protein